MKKKKKKRIILLMDRCAAYSPQAVLENVQAEFFPQNSSSALQPFDLGIITNFKEITISPWTYCKPWNLFSVAWQLVASSTINNFFRKPGALLEEAAADDNDSGDEVVSGNELALVEVA
ncbi:tigger transposable element-derived protein 6-like [Schistocerca piceifrons]|uniref:tigger transposable element-derived protein 6-like n=1 Tax=Schistocerca piceifrons TaxID=274613 RepID=UPI001F5FEB6B|nr:tigger transposable element-derived protein 6-like [Schistocerca piceifrons]